MNTKIKTIIITLMAAGSFAVALPAGALAMYPTVWTYGPGVAQPQPAHPYDLSVTEKGNNIGQNSLVYGVQQLFSLQVGAELEWASGTHKEWEFKRQSSHPATNAITGTERVALYNYRRGEYLIREHQYVGISLGFSSTPSYQWQVADGTPSPGLGGVELYNTQEQGYLLQCWDACAYSSVWPGENPNLVELEWLHAPFSLPAGYQPPAEGGQAREGVTSPVAPAGPVKEAPPKPPIVKEGKAPVKEVVTSTPPATTTPQVVLTLVRPTISVR